MSKFSIPNSVMWYSCQYKSV